MGEPAEKKPRIEDEPQIKYTKIFINNEWTDSGELLLTKGVEGWGSVRWIYKRASYWGVVTLSFTTDIDR